MYLLRTLFRLYGRTWGVLVSLATPPDDCRFGVLWVSFQAGDRPVSITTSLSWSPLNEIGRHQLSLYEFGVACGLLLCCRLFPSHCYRKSDPS